MRISKLKALLTFVLLALTMGVMAQSVEIGTVEAVIQETDLIEINNCRQKTGQLIDSSYDGSYVTFKVNTTTTGTYLFTSMIGTTVDGAAITLGYLDANGEYAVSEKKDITNSKNWNDGPNYTWEFDLEADNEYTFKILCHTANGSGYCVNLFAMTIGMEGMVTPEYTVTYSLGDIEAEGVVPTAVKVKAGQEVTIPDNFTLYVEGKTLTGWTDGKATYAADAKVAPTADMTLTPIFTDNEVSLADRTEAVTLKWDFQRQNGAPTVGWQGTSGHIWVTQATVKGEIIDVKCDIDVTNGKVANANWTDWAQINGGTKVTIPSCKGAVVSMEAYSAPTTTTIDGQTDYTANGNTISYIVANTAEAIDVVIGDGSYYRYIQTVLPVVEQGGVFEQVTLGTAVSSTEAGSVTVYPANETYDINSEVTLTATENFGYDFVNWTDSKGTVLSTESSFNYTISADETLTANFKQVNTYELTMAVEGGANDYMVSYNPAPTMVDGKQMYEEGTEVTLTASGNAVLTFNNWSNGQTSSKIEVTMNDNVELTANYSAIDYIVGWDFYKKGNNGRVADFYSTAENESAQLILTDESGTMRGWLDRSTLATNGYESMKGAAVNWQKIGEKFYYQTKVNASEFTDIKVQAEMLYSYIAYKTQKIEYSVDGTNWTEAGRATMPAAKTITDITASLGEDANNAAELYIRFIPDYSSDRVGYGDGDDSNDGTSITNIFITGTKKLVDDGKAPAVVSTVPVEGATNASANGRVVVNFDEKIKLTDDAKATLNGEELELTVSGKTVTVAYKALAYATEYTFELAAGSVSDLTDNVMDEAVSVKFTTMTKPVVTKALYDFIVPDNGNFKEALEAAAARTDYSKRYRIFVKRGAHIVPGNENDPVTGADGNSYADPKTYFNTPNVSIIGEDMAETSIANYMTTESYTGDYGEAHPLEGIRTSGLLYLQSGATNTYFEDITLKSNTPDSRGRNVVLVDGGNKTICKDVCLWAYQDTYVSDQSSSLYYFEGGVIRGRTDFICGSGDVFFNGVDIVMCEKGGYIVAPRDNVKYGYVFNDCTIKGGNDEVNGNYYLGRPWTEAAETYFIDCVMEAIPTAAGWTNMSAGGTTRFAEYNSTTASGSVVDLSGRATELGNTTVNPNNPILTAEEAAEIGNMSNMFGDWDPTLATEQASAPTNVKMDENVITWDDDDYVLLWAICKDGKVIDFTIEPTYTVDDATATYSVRAANEMGGLGDATEAVKLNVLVIDDKETECADFNPASESYDRVVYNRELKTDYTYGLICLPFAPDAESLKNFQFYALSSADNEAITFEEVDAPEAAKPYLYSIKDGATRTSTITGGATTFDLNDPTAVINFAAGTWELVGSLKNKTINCTADPTTANYVFNPVKSTLHKVTKTLTVYPYTAYVRNNTSTSVATMRVYISGPTGIKEISRDDIEGFNTAEGMFDLQGRAISKPMKGQIYIQNGVKRIQK